MDLIGVPFQLIVGPKGVKAGEIEVKVRNSGERFSIAIDTAAADIAARIAAARRPA